MAWLTDPQSWLALVTGGRRGLAEFIPFAEKLAARGMRVVLHDRRNTGASDVIIDGADGEDLVVLFRVGFDVDGNNSTLGGDAPSTCAKGVEYRRFQ